MSALTLYGSALRGPVRVVVRQHKRALIIAGVLVLAVIGVLIGATLWNSYLTTAFEAGSCSGAGDPGRGCYQRVRDHLDAVMAFSRLLMYTSLLLTALPALAAGFIAGPMIARELETGTYKVAWTQSVTPTHWLAAKLAVPAVLSLACVSLLSGVVGWTRSHTSTDYPVEWFNPPVFSATGTAPLGYTLLGLAAGALTGLLIRRTVAAMSAAALATGAVIVLMATLRRGLWPVRTVSGASLDVDGDIWWLNVGRITGDGERLPIDMCMNIDDKAESRCLADHDITGTYLDYHPASHFWPLQLMETGILLALAALAVTLAFRVLRRRHG
jgi:hypothetical protein